MSLDGPIRTRCRRPPQAQTLPPPAEARIDPRERSSTATPARACQPGGRQEFGHLAVDESQDLTLPDEVYAAFPRQAIHQVAVRGRRSSLPRASPWRSSRAARARTGTRVAAESTSHSWRVDREIGRRRMIGARGIVGHCCELQEVLEPRRNGLRARCRECVAMSRRHDQGHTGRPSHPVLGRARCRAFRPSTSTTTSRGLDS